MQGEDNLSVVKQQDSAHLGTVIFVGEQFSFLQVRVDGQQLAVTPEHGAGGR